MSHLLHSFFIHTYGDIANGFIYGFGLDVEAVSNLATRRDAWLNIFNVIPYIASIWAFIILAKRLSIFNVTGVKKVLAFVFASSLITLYLGLNIYKVYVFKTYGMKKHLHHGSMMHHKNSKKAVDLKSS